jgi:hypothetical protein
LFTGANVLVQKLGTLSSQSAIWVSGKKKRYLDTDKVQATLTGNSRCKKSLSASWGTIEQKPRAKLQGNLLKQWSESVREFQCLDKSAANFFKASDITPSCLGFLHWN